MCLYHLPSSLLGPFKRDDENDKNNDKIATTKATKATTTAFRLPQTYAQLQYLKNVIVAAALDFSVAVGGSGPVVPSRPRKNAVMVAPAVVFAPRILTFFFLLTFCCCCCCCC